MSRFGYLSVSCWVLVGLAALFFYYRIYTPTFLLLFTGWLITGSLLIAARIWRLYRDGFSIGGLGMVGLLLLVPFVLRFCFEPLSWLGLLWSFERLQEVYEPIVAAQSSPGWHATPTISYAVDPGPPPRIAFPLEGSLDNWHAVVYDPSGLILRQRWTEFEEGDRAAIELFGDYLSWCERIDGDYALCEFH